MVLENTTSAAIDPGSGGQPNYWKAAAQTRAIEIGADRIPSMLSGASRRQVAEHIDHDIEELKQILLEFTARRNTYTAISHIPLEVIGEVMHYVSDIDPPQPPLISDSGRPISSQPRAGGNLGWVRLSHVCQTWRNLLFRLPRIWARHIGTLPRALDTMLRYAGTFPLNVYVFETPYRPYGPETTDVVLDEAERIALLRVSEATHWGVVSRLNTLSGRTLPNLREVDLDTSQLRVAAEDYARQPIVAPRLTFLSLRNCFIPWTAISLTHLTILLTPPLPDDDRPSLIQFFDILRGSPALEILRVAHVIPDMMRLPWDFNVMMQALRSMHLVGPLTRSLAFLRILSYPALTELIVRPDLPQTDSYPLYKKLFQVIAEFIQQPDQSSHAALGLGISQVSDRTHNLSIVLGKEESQRPISLCSSRPPFIGNKHARVHLSLPPQTGPYYVTRIFYGLSSALDADVMQSITLRTLSHQRSDWVVYLQRPGFRHVHTLNLENPDPALVAALGDPSMAWREEDENDAGPSRAISLPTPGLLLPALHTLRLKRNPKDPWHDQLEWGPLIEMLCARLQHRIGHPERRSPQYLQLDARVSKDHLETPLRLPEARVLVPVLEWVE
ncbi:hypothetical protein OF83DRAFT_322418 [Amylostereum chailletii]|nr:hypothetical protein OF83DRAFT_322418 [Amylostereum chailletii]